MNADFMKEAINLAKKGMGFTSPNPLVGAVIVKDGIVIGRGYHEKYGQLHAERNAFKDCDSKGIDCRGADLYVTLEPCCHHGKTPPCTEAIIEHGIKRVFVGSPDPNPLVSGGGVRLLREHNIEVTENVLRTECDKINEIFFHFITTGKPFVTMKYAMTIDGKIACFTGESKWITGEEARHHVQQERLRHSAVMVGIGTVIADDPLLTCRIEGGRNPIRIICDTRLRIPTDCNIVKTASSVPTIIATCSADEEKISLLQEKGCRIMNVPEKDNHVDIAGLIGNLGKMNIDSVLLEGGGELNWSALRAGVVTKIQSYIAPKIFGGRDAKTPVSGAGVPLPSESFALSVAEITTLGGDILIESRVKNVHGNS